MSACEQRGLLAVGRSAKMAGFQLLLLALMEVLVDAADAALLLLPEGLSRAKGCCTEKYFMLSVNVWSLNAVLLYRAERGLPPAFFFPVATISFGFMLMMISHSFEGQAGFLQLFHRSST